MIDRRTLLARLAAAPFLAGRPRPASADTPLALWTSEIEPARLRVIEYIATAYGAWAGVPPVTVVSIPEEKIVASVAAAHRAGHSPDLVNTGGDLLLALCETGCLDSDVAAAFIADIGGFFAGPVIALRSSAGFQAGIPFHGWPQVLWYRHDMFATAGLPEPGNIPDLVAAAKALHEGPRGRIGVVCGTDGGLYTQQVFAQMVRAESGSLFAADGTPTLDDASVHRTLASYAAMAVYGPPGVVNWRARDWYIQGRAAMMFYSSLIMDDLAIAGIARDSLRGDRFAGLGGAAFDPELVRRTKLVTAFAPTGASYSAINGLGVPRGLDGRRRTAVYDFLRFLFRPDSYVVWLHMAPGGMLPVRRDIAGTDAFLRDPLGVFRRFGRDQVSRLADSLTHPGSFTQWHGTTVPNAATVHADGLVGRMVARVVAGAASPANSARAAQAEAEALLLRG
ncbi:ABC transporter substrate-binding protein [Shumkonia mesophila]|uniref:ABC transporter substrate-binding protein n=1 Tax=Shumkonia mesophila TaxID=2838854 RepID=UPI0029341F43|nr:extracellular solute-binding protein [Shumkonia mesophila]